MRFHLPARDHVVMDWAPALYMIRVDGHLGAMALPAFPGMTPQQKGPHTVLAGWLDQSALYGVLAQMESLGLVLLEVPDGAARKVTGIRGHPPTLRAVPARRRSR